MTFTLSAPVVATEGAVYSFTITPTAALADATMIRWQIVPKGALPVTSSDFPSLTGMLSFTSGATTAQTVTFTPTDDARREISKDFELRIYDTADDTTPLDTQVVTLRDNDDATGTYGNDILTGNGDANIIGFGTTHAVTANGSAGSDFYVISRFQYGNVEITDTVGTNLVKFDAGVTITDYDEESADGFVKVISRVDLTLSTGAVITIINPVGKFVFQLGSDPIITTYDEFKGEIRAEGSNETSTLRNNEAFQVLTATTDPDISGNSLSAQFSPSFGSASVDIFSSASTFGFSQNGSAGDDFYVISRFQYGNVEITDTVGTNLIKFDVGVTITDYDEESADGFVKVISRVDLTLSTGAVITIINPVGKFVFQLGDDAVIATYAEFKGEIRAEGSNETSTLRNNEAFPIPFPSTASDAVFDSLPSLALVEQQDGSATAIVVGTVAATDADDDPITYRLTADTSAGEDATGFAIDSTTGQITYVGTGITRASSQTIMFTVVATSTGADGTDTDVTQRVTIDITANTAPTIDQVTATVINGFTGHTNLFANGQNDDGGIFHYSGSILRGSRDATDIPDLVVYLPDGTIVNIPAQDDFGFAYDRFIFAYLWIEQASDGTWVLATSPDLTLPTHGRPFYTLGVYNGDASIFFYPYDNTGNILPVTGQFVRDGQLIIENDFTVNSAENQDTVTTFSATDTTPNGLTWSLGGADAALFKIDSAGVITWINEPDYETLDSDSGDKEFRFTATATDGLDASNSIDVVVTLTDVNDAPIIMNTIEGFTGYTNLSARGVDGNGDADYSGGVFHHTLTIEYKSRSSNGEITAIGEGVAYLPDGTVVEIPAQDRFFANNGDFAVSYLWLQQAADETWELAHSYTHPISSVSSTYYYLGAHDPDAGEYYHPPQTFGRVGEYVEDATLVVVAGTTLAVDSVENQNTVVTLSATDPEVDTLTWELTGGADMNRFAIDRDTGEITWVTSPEFDSVSSVASTKEFQVTATVTDTGGGSDEIALTVTLIDNTDPVIGTVIEDFTGYTNVFVNGDDDRDGTFHYSGRLLNPFGAARTENLVIYLDDGTVIDIPDLFGSSEYDNASFWVELVDGDNDPSTDAVWELRSSDLHFFPTTGTYYHLGDFNGSTLSLTVSGTRLSNARLDLGTTALTFESFENQNMVVDMLLARDDTFNGLTWSLEDATIGDARLFNIDSETGAITWKTAPDYETLNSADSDKDFVVTARVTDGGGLYDSVELTITLTDVLETAPVITRTIEEFKGYRDVPAKGEDIHGVDDLSGGVFHHTATFTPNEGDKDKGEESLGGAISEGAVAYLPDSTIVELPNTYDTATSAAHIWLEDADDDGIWELADGSLPTDGRTFYAFGEHEGQAGEFVYYGTEVAAVAPLDIVADTSFKVDSDEGQDAVITLGATDATPSGLTWSLADTAMSDSADRKSFNIGSETGVITWATTPNFDTTQSAASSKEFSLVAAVTDGDGFMDTLALTVTLIDVP